MRNQLEQQKQMRDRSGPRHEKAVTRSRQGTAAWNAAGRPAGIKPVLVPVTFTERDGQRYGVEYETRYYLAKSMRHAGRFTNPDEWVEATPEQAETYATCADASSGRR